jgi:hypothetical protein
MDYTRNVKSSISTFPTLPCPVEMLNFSLELSSSQYWNTPYGIGMKLNLIGGALNYTSIVGRPQTHKAHYMPHSCDHLIAI